MNFQCLVLLLVFTVTANFGGTFAELTDITFPLRLLQPDLRAFSEYYENVELHRHYFAFLEWPDSITYRMYLIYSREPKAYVKIDGIFETTRMTVFVARHKAIYYKVENGRFFVPKTNDLLKPISADTLVRYLGSEPIIKKPADSYLSIRYFSLEELKHDIETFYLKNINYVKRVSSRYPSTYLTTPLNPENHFVEYTFSGPDSTDTLADGKLRVLVGRVKKGELNLKNNTDAYRLVFDQERLTCTVPERFDIRSEPIKNVFGVRMASVGFLSEVRSSKREHKVTTLSSQDLIPAPAFNRGIFVHDLLKKVRTVEPRYSPELLQATDVPKSVKFQMFGQVFVKKVNLKNGVVDKQCPFTIEYANKRGGLAFGRRLPVKKIYTDDTALWVGGQGPVPVQDESVYFMY